jgi:tRNA(Ile2) C34 agmatinyltransferase TiaS
MVKKCSCGGDMKSTGSYKIGDDTYDTYKCRKCGRESEVRRLPDKDPWKQ